MITTLRDDLSVTIEEFFDVVADAIEPTDDNEVLVSFEAESDNGMVYFSAAYISAEAIKHDKAGKFISITTDEYHFAFCYDGVPLHQSDPLALSNEKWPKIDYDFTLDTGTTLTFSFTYFPRGVFY